MASGADGVPVVELPERVDRRLRLGPFPTAQDALKFLCYAAAGAVVGQFASVPAGLALAGAGFLAAVWRPEGRAWDARAFTFLRWKWRAVAGGSRVTPSSPGAAALSRLVRLAPSDYVAIVRTGGVPVTYLPPPDLARRFELYRDLLRSTDGRLGFLVTLASIRSAPFVPPPAGPRSADAEARAGYAELVDLLCRRRFRRRVYLALGTTSAEPEAIARLETQVAAVEERLTALGLRPVRLTDRGLADAARQIGWSAGKENR